MATKVVTAREMVLTANKVRHCIQYFETIRSIINGQGADYQAEILEGLEDLKAAEGFLRQWGQDILSLTNKRREKGN